MDFELFCKCLELYLSDTGTPEEDFQKTVGNAFFDWNGLSQSDKGLGRDAGDCVLYQDLGAIPGFQNNPAKTYNALQNLKRGKAKLSIAYALAFLTYQRKSKYSYLRLPIGDGLVVVLAKYTRAARKELNRPPQPDLSGAEVDQSFYDLQLLHYAYDQDDKVPLLGREKEQAELIGFLECEAPFLWLQIAGAAGQGKSRLAWELVQHARAEMGYQAGFMTKIALEDFAEQWIEWSPDAPTLIVIDYVADPSQMVGPMMALLMARSDTFQHPVRLVLVERQRWDTGAIQRFQPRGEKGLGETDLSGSISERGYNVTESDFVLSSGRAAWFDTLRAQRDVFADQYRDILKIKEISLKTVNLDDKASMHQGSGVIELSKLDSDALADIVQAVSKQPNAVFVRKKIIRGLARLDASGRPLYAYCLGTALKESKYEESWTKYNVLDRMLTHYRRRRWTEAGKPPEFADNDNGLYLAVAATVLRAIPFDDLVNWPFGQLDSSSIRTAMAIVGATRSAEISGLGRLLPGMLPDLLGEWFVLSVFQNQVANTQRILEWCWECDPAETASFCLRIAQDFTELRITKKILNYKSKGSPQRQIESFSKVAAEISSILLSSEDSFRKSPFSEYPVFPELVLEALEFAGGSDDAYALNVLGVLYINAKLMEPNDKKAFNYILAAAKLKHPPAITNLGFSYQHGIGVNVDLREAMKHFRNAAEKGNISAMIALAENLRFGVGCEVADATEAVLWLEKASEAGSGEAKIQLSDFVYRGYPGQQPDKIRAQRLREEAALEGHTSMLYSLAGALLTQSALTDQKFEAALEYLEEAHKANDSKRNADFYSKIQNNAQSAKIFYVKLKKYMDGTGKRKSTALQCLFCLGRRLVLDGEIDTYSLNIGGVEADFDIIGLDGWARPKETSLPQIFELLGSFTSLDSDKQIKILDVRSCFPSCYPNCELIEASVAVEGGVGGKVYALRSDFVDIHFDGTWISIARAMTSSLGKLQTPEALDAYVKILFHLLNPYGGGFYLVTPGFMTSAELGLDEIELELGSGIERSFAWEIDRDVAKSRVYVIYLGCLFSAELSILLTGAMKGMPDLTEVAFLRRVHCDTALEFQGGILTKKSFGASLEDTLKTASFSSSHRVFEMVFLESFNRSISPNSAPKEISLLSKIEMLTSRQAVGHIDLVQSTGGTSKLVPTCFINRWRSLEPNELIDMASRLLSHCILHEFSPDACVVEGMVFDLTFLKGWRLLLLKLRDADSKDRLVHAIYSKNEVILLGRNHWQMELLWGCEGFEVENEESFSDFIEFFLYYCNSSNIQVASQRLVASNEIDVQNEIMSLGDRRVRASISQVQKKDGYWKADCFLWYQGRLFSAQVALYFDNSLSPQVDLWSLQDARDAGDVRKFLPIRFIDESVFESDLFVENCFNPLGFKGLPSREFNTSLPSNLVFIFGQKDSIVIQCTHFFANAPRLIVDRGLIIVFDGSQYFSKVPYYSEEAYRRLSLCDEVGIVEAFSWSYVPKVITNVAKVTVI